MALLCPLVDNNGFQVNSNVLQVVNDGLQVIIDVIQVDKSMFSVFQIMKFSRWFKWFSVLFHVVQMVDVPARLPDPVLPGSCLRLVCHVHCPHQGKRSQWLVKLF